MIVELKLYDADVSSLCRFWVSVLINSSVPSVGMMPESFPLLGTLELNGECE